MSLETAAVKGTRDVASKGIRITDGIMKKAWSILEAAVEKKSPHEKLSKRAVSNIQGIHEN